MTKKISAILLSVLMMAVFIPTLSFGADDATSYVGPSGVVLEHGTSITNESAYKWDGTSNQLHIFGHVIQVWDKVDDYRTEATGGGTSSVHIASRFNNLNRFRELD